MSTKKTIFSNLSKSALKGQNGTILIIGGSQRYTGAPIFTALGSFRSGSDLVYIFTSRDAVCAIKSLHEAIVMPLQFDHFILDKITACVIGPGLGFMSNDEINLIKEIANYLNERNIPFVIDADGIHLYKQGLFSNLKTCVLTPNYKEAQRLIVEKYHYCIYKGKIDKIIHNQTALEIDTPSSLKRCGGQGDILSGILATALTIHGNNVLKACADSCELIRKASFESYKIKGFSLITSDIFEFIIDSLLSEVEP